jgi:hypothetical protein
VLRPWLGRGAAGFWAGSVLIDVDHYAWFCLRQHCWSPVAAMRFFNEAHAPQHSATRVLHSPVAPIAVLALAAHRRWLLPVAVGMALHVVLDARHEARMDEARGAALERDGFSCQMCGARAHVGTHLRRQPWLLPAYSEQDLISLCAPCHVSAHTGGT